MTEINKRIEEAVKFLGLGMTEIEEDDGYYFITPKYKKVFSDKLYQLFTQPLDELKVLVDGEWVEASKELKDTVRSIEQALPDKGLGEKIASLMGEKFTKESRLELTDQILALLQPKIEEAFNEGVKRTTDAMDSTFDAQLEEARRQERERIFKILRSKYLGSYAGDSCIMELRYIDFTKRGQALKGGE